MLLQNPTQERIMQSGNRRSNSIMAFDWVLVMGMLGALGLLLFILLANGWAPRERADMQAYLKTGIAPPR